jgi:hypothetical protein
MHLWVRLLNKLKPDNYSKTDGVNVADRWRGRLCSYLGRSDGNVVEMKFKMATYAVMYS